MLSEQRVQGIIFEISEKLETLGYKDFRIIEPPEAEDENEGLIYHIFVEGQGANFYITLSPEWEYGGVTYPYNIARYVGNQLDDDEVEAIFEASDREPEGDNISNGTKIEIAGLKVIENTPIDSLWNSKFSLSAYASTALTRYESELADNGFPRIFRCYRSILPYTDDFSLRTLDNRIESITIAGNRGARYVESSLVVQKETEPENYILQAYF